MSPKKAALVELADRDNAILQDFVRSLARQAARHYVRTTKTSEPAQHEIAPAPLDEALNKTRPDTIPTGVKTNDDVK